ncbi:molybdopterin molybdotransferase MoeA [Tundrisphaera lichenicola]|uniref:molybdopterin molybdotransferase MoeA n=1 Tax=Tundrisphaera lichenicola TaxID=2029860 RepID=UPI003EC019EE
MRGFRSRVSVEAVVKVIDTRIVRLEPESVTLDHLAGRVLSAGVTSSVSVPAFDRAAMDGYALRGEETFGSDAYNPISFQVVGRVRPGKEPDHVVGAGEASEIATGAPLPSGADTVVKVEATEFEGSIVRVFEPTPPGRHVGLRGEDISRGTEVLRAGRVLRPQDLGILSAIGAGRVEVIRRPEVVILVTGDELLPSGRAPESNMIADANSPMLAALVRRDGGIPRVIGPLLDDRKGIRSSMLDALKNSDCLMISGGSSTGPEDHAPGLLAELGELTIHGIAIRPASPAGLGFVGRVPVVLLPGNPVSCLCAYDFFACPIVRRLGGRSSAWPYRASVLPLAQKLSSVVGRVDYARVSIDRGQVVPMAISGASILSSTTRADGFVVVPSNLEGYPAGSSVTVWLYDQDG